MRKKIEITAGYSGKIPMGQFENEQPFYSIKEIIEDDGVITDDMEIKKRQETLQDMCYAQFKQQAERSKAERIASELSTIRFYNGDNGLKYPSITSIIGWNKDFFISPEELNQYASRGTIIDKQVEHYLDQKEWLTPKELIKVYPEIFSDFVIVKKGSLDLDIENINFVSFYKKFPFKVISQQNKVLNHKHRYGGRSEIKCIIESSNPGGWEKIDGVLFDVPTILDIKATGSLDKLYVLKQTTAAAYCDLHGDVKQVGAIHLTKNNKCGYAKPLIETDLEKFWPAFLKDRSAFKKRYGI